jgi:hypothetical protein
MGKAAKRHPVFRHFTVMDNKLFRIDISGEYAANKFTEIKSDWLVAVGISGSVKDRTFIYPSDDIFQSNHVEKYNLVLGKTKAYDMPVYERDVQRYLYYAFYCEDTGFETAGRLQELLNEAGKAFDCTLTAAVTAPESSSMMRAKILIVNDDLDCRYEVIAGEWIVIGNKADNRYETAGYSIETFSNDKFHGSFDEWKGE